ncbi:hypothetical protein AcW1_004233 [Taiwanofungus camphoratus]|nr:hypothetical protein AcW1_004233 [Antrodia cinnamomea]
MLRTQTGAGAADSACRHRAVDVMFPRLAHVRDSSSTRSRARVQRPLAIPDRRPPACAVTTPASPHHRRPPRTPVVIGFLEPPGQSLLRNRWQIVSAVLSLVFLAASMSRCSRQRLT